MRVSELAKSLKIPTKDLLEKLKSLRIPAKAATSTLDADAINRVRRALAAQAQAQKTAAAIKAQAAKAAAAAKKAAAEKAAAAKAAAAAVKAEAQKLAEAKAAEAQAAADAKAAAEPKTAKAAEPAAPPKPAEKPQPPRPAARPAGPAPKAPVRSITPMAPGRPQPIPHAAPAGAAAAVLAPPKPKGQPKAEPAAPPPPAAPAAPAAAPEVKQLQVRFPITVKDLAAAMEVSPTELIKHLMQQGVFASMVQQLDEASAKKVAATLHFELSAEPGVEERGIVLETPDPAKLVLRAPVVTFMGHVDHGKTSLMDAIRQTKVAEGEAGGITQHIGAYEVALEKGRVTFLDTPGHEAFSALRARGANVTDVVVLVVAADDGVMPQTIEAIDHAKAAGVPIVVAINKMDKADANPQRVKQQLAQHQLQSEDWGGKTIMVPVSARTREGIDSLLEMLLLEAELLELKADPTIRAQGTVIEAKQTSDRGPVVTVLVQQGTLRVGETVLVGHVVGRVRAMTNDRGMRVKEAGPSRPVELLGMPEVPKAGDKFQAVSDEKLARQIAERRKEQRAQRAIAHPKRITLEDLHSQIKEGKLKDLRLIVKADVQGSLEAIVQSLQKLDTEKEEVQFQMLHAGVGDINESDIVLAAASDAIIVGFHVGIEPQVQVLAAAEGVDVHIYQIIYELVSAIKAAIEGLLEPTIEETFIGRAEVRKLFQVSRSGMVAGCMVTKGVIRRDATMRVVRGRERIYEGKIASLKRVKDDAREVTEGVECGILLDGKTDIQVGDLLEAWELKKVARKLS